MYLLSGIKFGDILHHTYHEVFDGPVTLKVNSEVVLLKKGFEMVLFVFNTVKSLFAVGLTSSAKGKLSTASANEQLANK
jgi:hypothetical protein